MSSLKRNVLFNFVGQFYIAFLGILILPLYLKHLGAEAYGLIGFFTLLQSWMQLLDLGITPTLGREISRLKDLPENHFELRTVVRSLEIIFITIALFMTISVFLGKDLIAQKWLTIQDLDLYLVGLCIGLMGIIAGFRWLSSLYRSGINAYEQQVWINFVDIILVTLRFPGSLFLIIITDGNLFLFFCFQLLLVIIELLAIRIKFYSLLPSLNLKIEFSSKTIKRIAPFSLSIAYTSSIWIFVTQLDKLLLSKVLSLAEYGYFTLIATISSGVMLLSGPISKAVLPRMTNLLAKGKEQEMLKLYRTASRFVVCIVAPVTLVIALFPSEIVFIWTGDKAAAMWIAPILPLFIIGNGLLTIGAFQYYLQYSHGKLRQHVVYNTVSAALSIPLIIYSAFKFGPVGVAWVWLCFRILSLLFWTPYIHHIFAPKIHNEWFLKDFLFPLITSLMLLLVVFNTLQPHFPEGRILGFITIALISGCVALITIGCSFFNEIKGYCIRAKI